MGLMRNRTRCLLFTLGVVMSKYAESLAVGVCLLFLIVFCLMVGVGVYSIDYLNRPYEYDTKLDTVQISHQTEWDGSVHRNKDATWMVYHRLKPIKKGTVIDFGSLGVWQVEKFWSNNGIHSHFCRRVELVRFELAGE